MSGVRERGMLSRFSVFAMLAIAGHLRFTSVRALQGFQSRAVVTGRYRGSVRRAGLATDSESTEKLAPKNFVDFPFAYHEEMELVIDDLTNLGMGVARKEVADGSSWVVMIPLVLPGERVRARIFRNHASYSEGDLVEVLEASPDRVEPLCQVCL